MAVESGAPYRLEREKTALIVVDMQNDFVRVGGALELPDARNRIGAVVELIEGCRAVGVPVVFTKFIAGPGRTLVWNWSPTIAPPTKCCWKNFKRFFPDVGKYEEVADIIDEISVLPEDHVVEKYAYGAFYNTTLEDVLRALHREYVIICGATMPICVNDTVSGAFERQFKVVVAEEATSSVDEGFREFSLRLFAFKYGRVATNRQILDELQGQSAQA